MHKNRLISLFDHILNQSFMSFIFYLRHLCLANSFVLNYWLLCFWSNCSQIALGYWRRILCGIKLLFEINSSFSRINCYILMLLFYFHYLLFFLLGLRLQLSSLSLNCSYSLLNFSPILRHLLRLCRVLCEDCLSFILNLDCFWLSFILYWDCFYLNCFILN